MKMTEFINNITSQSTFISGSLLLKSADNLGCTYKWLEGIGTVATRRQVFIAFNPEESELPLLDKTVVNSIEVYPAK